MFFEVFERIAGSVRRRWGWLLTVLIVLFVFRGCIFKGEPAKQTAAPASVTTAIVTKKDVPFELSAIGSVEASSSVSVNTQVSGILEKAHFNEGDFVKEGDLLFTIDPAPFEAALHEKEGNLAMQRARAVNADTELKRSDDLRKKDFVTQSQYDQAKADANSFRAAVQAAEAAVENAKLQLAYTRITAPISGRSGDLLVRPGNLLKANDVASVMLKINQIKPVFVRFSLPEQYVSRVREQMRKSPLVVKAGLKGDAGRFSEGKVTFVDNAVDTKTGMILIKATFPNDDEMLWPGQFLEVRLVLYTQQNAIVLPGSSVMTGQQGQYVFVVKPDLHVEIKTLKVLFSNGDNTIVEDGIQPGDEIVTDGQMGLASGALIVKKNPQTKTE